MNGRYNINPPVNGGCTQADVTYSASTPANNVYYVNQPNTCYPPNNPTGGYQSNAGSVHTTFSIFAPPTHHHGHPHYHHDYHHHHGHHHGHDHHHEHDHHHSDCSLS